MSAQNVGIYIVFEGQDGIGKTTQVELLRKYFEKLGKKVLCVKEPGGGNLESTKKIRELLKNKDYNLEAESKVLLFTTDRIELFTKVIKPALEHGEIVISDRNWWSTLAYESAGFGISSDLIKDLHQKFLPERYLYPDMGIILDLDETERCRRMMARGIDQQDSFESQNNDFQKRVSVSYREIAKDFHLDLVDASGTPDEMHQEIVKQVELVIK